MVKNAPILLIFCVNKYFGKLILHTKYEQNRSIFDHFQNFGPFYFDNTKKRCFQFLICYSKKANFSEKRSKIKEQVGALRPIFDWEGHISNGHCAAVFGSGPKLFDYH